MELYCLPYLDLCLSAFSMIAKEKKKVSFTFLECHPAMSKGGTDAISQAGSIQSILTRSWEGGGLGSIVICPLHDAVQSVCPS